MFKPSFLNILVLRGKSGKKVFDFIKKARPVTTPIMTSLEKENFERESFQSFFLPIKNERISFKY